MDFESACKRAVSELKEKGYMEGICEIVDAGKYWLFRGVMDLESGTDYGANPVSIEKETGKIVPFFMGKDEDRKMYYEGKEMEIPEEYNLHLVKKLIDDMTGDNGSVIKTRAIFEVVNKKEKSPKVIKCLEDLEGDNSTFFNMYLVSDFATAALDILGVKKYSGQREEIERLILSGLQIEGE